MLCILLQMMSQVKIWLRRLGTTVPSCASHYDALGLTPKATQGDIKSAYYKLSMRYHPDKASNVSVLLIIWAINTNDRSCIAGIQDTSFSTYHNISYRKLYFRWHHKSCSLFQNEDSAKKFRAITEAYEVLGNIKLKKMYDKGKHWISAWYLGTDKCWN